MSSISEPAPVRGAEGLGRTLAAAAAVAVVAAGLQLARIWEAVDNFVFDAFTVASPSRAGRDSPVVVVGIDEPSFAEVGLRWPWPREFHARVVERLTGAGATAIVFDIVFAEPSTAEGDRAFASAIAESGRVVLAGDVVLEETGHFRSLQRVEPLRAFREAGAFTGISSVEVDGDQVVRRFPGDPEALWRVALGLHREGAGPGPRTAPAPGERTMLRYSDGSDVTYASYYQALDPEALLPPGFFRGRIVLVGLHLKTSPNPRQRGADTYATPFFRFSKLYAPGVELQAQFVAAAAAGATLRPIAPAWSIALAVLGLAAGVVAMRRWRLLPCTLFAFGSALALAALAFALFRGAGAWLPVALPAGIVLGLYAVRGATAYADEIRQKIAIRRAFESYVAPTVVSQMTSHPERLILGGERRELTVLFTDLAGFTSLAEDMAPEAVAAILNEHLTRMTRVVLDHGGTIDKFIGDAVMAFWGAPIDDPGHARHALEAAIAMQAEMAHWARESGGGVAARLAMRIGVNTGPVVVGNLGSRLRFDYTVIGDAVNLASRLEGANRLYGTQILVGESTAAGCGGAVALRHVDRIRVKGKRDAIEVFTPAAGADLGSLDEEAIAAYRSAQWNRAEELWRQVLERVPGDSIASLYLARIAQNRHDGVPSDWDGAFSLDSK